MYLGHSEGQDFWRNSVDEQKKEETDQQKKKLRR